MLMNEFRWRSHRCRGGGRRACTWRLYNCPTPDGDGSCKTSRKPVLQVIINAVKRLVGKSSMRGRADWK